MVILEHLDIQEDQVIPASLVFQDIQEFQDIAVSQEFQAIAVNQVILVSLVFQVILEKTETLVGHRLTILLTAQQHQAIPVQERSDLIMQIFLLLLLCILMILTMHHRTFQAL